MTLPEARPGLVFRYDYLWQREAERGRETSKDRPACLAVASDSSVNPRMVLILPITHRKPSGSAVGLEIPENVRRALKLDDAKCWIVVSEANVDEWPNPGIAPIPGQKQNFVYGFLPPALYATVKTMALQYLDAKHRIRR